LSMPAARTARAVYLFRGLRFCRAANPVNLPQRV
jgi:hypothetical protein